MNNKSKYRVEFCTLVLTTFYFLAGCGQGLSTSRNSLLEDTHNSGVSPTPNPPVSTTTTTFAPPPPPLPTTDPDLSDRCQSEVQCWTFPGLVHMPIPGSDYKRVEVKPRPGNYTKIRMSVVVVNRGWRVGMERKSHELLWIARDGRHRDLLGYLFAQGPGTNSIVMRSDIGVEAGLKQKTSKRFQMEVGHHYRFISLYDMGTGRALSVVFNQSGQEVLRLQQTPNAHYLNFDNRQKISVDFGFVEGANPNEPATYNWEYKDLMIEAHEVP